MRPQLAQHTQPTAYLSAMLEWRKQTEPGFSIRKGCQNLCSPALVSLVLSGQKKLMSEKATVFAEVCGLTPRETEAFCEKFGFVKLVRSKPASTQKEKRSNGSGNNHLLSNWLNLYVKDLCRLKSFNEDPALIAKNLNGLATAAQVKKSLEFLLHHGYLRRNLQGKLVENENFTESTEEIPNQDIRNFHKRALGITAENIDKVPVTNRDAYALLLPLDRASFSELKYLLKEFQMRLAQFVEQHSSDNETLYQVVLHLTPVTKDQT